MTQITLYKLHAVLNKELLLSPVDECATPRDGAHGDGFPQMQTLAFLKSLPVFNECACTCVCACVCPTCVCVCMCSRSMNMWVCALSPIQRPEQAMVSSSVAFHLSPLRQGLSLNLKLTFSDPLAAGNSQPPPGSASDHGTSSTCSHACLLRF